jgi:hypothetical protein
MFHFLTPFPPPKMAGAILGMYTSLHTTKTPSREAVAFFCPTGRQTKRSEGLCPTGNKCGRALYGVFVRVQYMQYFVESIERFNVVL